MISCTPELEFTEVLLNFLNGYSVIESTRCASKLPISYSSIALHQLCHGGKGVDKGHAPDASPLGKRARRN